jgi:hypothetical protein
MHSKMQHYNKQLKKEIFNFARITHFQIDEMMQEEVDASLDPWCLVIDLVFLLMIDFQAIQILS